MKYSTSLVGGIKTYAQFSEEVKGHHYSRDEILMVDEMIRKTIKAMDEAYPSGENYGIYRVGEKSN